MKVCDGCGALGLARGCGVNVIEFRFGHGLGRTLDLCGGCRSSFHTLVSEWIESRTDAAKDARWTPSAALAYIKTRPGDADADKIIRDLASQILDVRGV